MRAVRLEAFGDYDQLKVSDVPRPEPADGEVLVEMRAAAVNPFDNTVRMGQAPGVQLPLVQGQEGTGVIAGEGSEALPAGTRVMFRGAYGFGRDGTWQEVVRVDRGDVVRVPDNLSDVEAGAAPIAYLAAELALKIGCGFTPNMTLLIPGVGGSVANAAIQIARAHGAGRIITTAGRTEKADKAQELGYDDVIDLSRESLSDGVTRLTDGKGVDVALDSVGGSVTGEALTSLGAGGKLVQMGYPGGTSVTVDVMNLIWKPASIHGFNMYFQSPEAFAEAWESVLKLLSSGRVRPLVDRTYPLEQAAEAQRHLIEDRPMGKVVLTF
jgi:NADPH2:quinone reductase